MQIGGISKSQRVWRHNGLCPAKSRTEISSWINLWALHEKLIEAAKSESNAKAKDYFTIAAKEIDLAYTKLQSASWLLAAELIFSQRDYQI